MGPIVPYHELEPALAQRTIDAQDVSDGCFRFTIGLAKKALLADALAGLVTGIWGDLASLTVLSAWLGLIGYALQQALAQAGTLDRPLVWCVLPLKNEALYDLEPAYFSDETGKTNKQALTAALAQVEGLTVIDAEAPLVTGTLADRERYFYKTDFHWNARGAFAAAQEIARQLAGAGTIAETSVPQAEDFLWSELGGERRYQGDLNVWFSNQFSMQEDIPRYVPKNAADLRYFLHPGDIESVPRETIVGSGLDKDPVTYNDVFTYNLGYYRVENPDAPEAASVLILKDSFQNATIDYLSAIFRSVTVVDPRSYQETPDLASLLDADGIDLVLFFYHQNNVSRELIDFLSA